MAEVVQLEEYRDKRAEALRNWLVRAFNSLSAEEMQRIMRIYGPPSPRTGGEAGPR